MTFRFIPQSTDDCEVHWRRVEDIPEGTCEMCGLNKKGGDCGHHPKKKKGEIIITASRFYAPEMNDEMIVVTPGVLTINEGDTP